MIQQIRSKLLPAATVAKSLSNDTLSLPSGVKGIVRIDGLASASMILRLLPSTRTIIILDVLTDDSGEAITDLPGGDTIETIS